MTTTSADARESGYDELRARHAAAAMAQLPDHVARMDWSALQIGAQRHQALARLLGVARARSPWHRARLAGVDLDTITPTTLSEIPPMTKDDLLAHFDEIVTALGLARAGVRSVVLERKERLDPHSRATLILPRTLEILRQWAVLNPLLAAGNRVPHVRLREPGPPETRSATAGRSR